MQSNNHLIDWLHRRGITDEVISLFGITAPHTHPTIGDCIRIPFSDEHAKYRRDPQDPRKPKYLYDSGGKVTLYGFENVRSLPPGRSNTVIITEGELDTLVLWSHNIPAVSSTGGAMSWQEEWSTLLQQYNVYICFDNDDTGAKGAIKILKSLPHAKIILIPEMPDVKDISDYVSRGGDFRKLVDIALPNDEQIIREDMSRRQGMMLSTRFHRAYFDEKHQALHRDSYQPSKYEGDDRILRAKSFPMTELIEFIRRKACCPWHNERTPSLHYYPKTNSAYCFGQCGKSYDSIDAYRLKHPEKTFKEALADLNKMV